MDVLEVTVIGVSAFCVGAASVLAFRHVGLFDSPNRSLTESEIDGFDEMMASVDRMSERIDNLEAILDAEHVGWREQETDAS